MAGGHWEEMGGTGRAMGVLGGTGKKLGGYWELLGGKRTGMELGGNGDALGRSVGVATGGWGRVLR